MSRKDKALLAVSGFFSGASFIILAFHFNHKDILNESPWLWSFCLLLCLAFSLKTIYKADKQCA